MIYRLTRWIRRREDPLADRLYRLAKRLRVIDLPVVPGLHAGLYRLHAALASAGGGLARILYWTPMFRSRLDGSHRRLHIAGGGMPLVSGPLRITMGDDCRLSSALTLSGRGAGEAAPQLEIGDNVGIGWQTTIAVGRRVVLEDHVRIAGRAFLAGYPGHPLDAAERAADLPDREEQVGDIVLRRDVWLGTGCIVNAGVEIGAGTVVAAGSIVTRDLPAGVLAAGAPARVIRALNTRRTDGMPLEMAA